MLAAVSELRRVHAQGVASWNDTKGGRPDYGTMKELDERGKSSELLRKARAFANVTSGYSPRELDALIGQCETEQFPLGASFVYRLVAVQKGSKREILQRRLIQGHWSRRQLDAEIARLVGNRRPLVGRKIRLPADPAEAMYLVTRLSKHLNHFLVAVNASSLELPPSVQRHITDARVPVEALIRCISRSNSRKKRTAKASKGNQSR